MSRVLATLLLGFQAVVWGGGPILEARPAADGLRVATHVEDVSQSHCQRIHSHLDCVICRALDSGALKGAPARLLPPPPQRTCAPHVEETSLSPSVRLLPLGPRAPPIA